ncbi:protein-tyrosine phosphatase family protein [Actinomadura rugatobispora]|uniref:Protein-tyrosine phosphatase family protein n=1 Tax=Actinomadura rugatobispora TaxID=1994 RepID=A0ABW1AEY3_9ACTN|nr:protein-tyrosine phosphatase family protein [Actinomadura rugatobispora]
MSDAHLTGSIRLPDGSRVRGRGLRRPLPSGKTPDHGLYLGGRRFRRRHAARLDLPWPHEWIDWPDFLLPRDGERAIGQIRDLHEHARRGHRVEVACGGGVGRTGTTIACMAILAGLPPEEAVSWTRANYHHRAVETPWQRKWVARFPAPRGH